MYIANGFRKIDWALHILRPTARTIGRIKSHIRARRYEMACRKSSTRPIHPRRMHIRLLHLLYHNFPFYFSNIRRPIIRQPQYSRLLPRRPAPTIVINFPLNALLNVFIFVSFLFLYDIV